MQVRATLTDGKIVSVEEVQVPSDGKSAAINSRARASGIVATVLIVLARHDRSHDSVTMGAEIPPFRRVEHHMSTAITLGGAGIDEATADQFFDRIRQLEDLLSRFRPNSQISRLARGQLDLDAVDPMVREVLSRCSALRDLTGGDFEHEPRRRSGDPRDPVLDVNALAKGWIIEEAATILRMTATEFFVNAGGDITTSRRVSGAPWRVGIQHPTVRSGIVGVFEVVHGAVATSGSYERGSHIRAHSDASLVSVTVVGPDLADADALATAVYALGMSPPAWWWNVEASYGLLTVSADNRLRWRPPAEGTAFEWQAPSRGASTESGVAPLEQQRSEDERDHWVSTEDGETSPQ